MNPIVQAPRRTHSVLFLPGWDDGSAVERCGEHVLQRRGARGIASVDSLVETTVRRVWSTLAVRTLSKVADSDGNSRSFLSPLTHETYRDIPSAYIFTIHDRAFEYEYQVETVERAAIVTLKTMVTGHTPWLTRPEVVIDFILSFVAELDRKRDRWPDKYG